MDFKTVVAQLKDLVYKWDDIQQICDLIILGAVLWNSSDKKIISTFLGFAKTPKLWINKISMMEINFNI